MFGVIQLGNGMNCGELALELLGLSDHFCTGNRQPQGVLIVPQGAAS
jgi:hypothetical protein